MCRRKEVDIVWFIMRRRFGKDMRTLKGRDEMPHCLGLEHIVVGRARRQTMTTNNNNLGGGRREMGRAH